MSLIEKIMMTPTLITLKKLGGCQCYSLDFTIRIIIRIIMRIEGLKSNL